MTFDASIEQFAVWIDQAASIAVLTGAGISVPSGIPDFRSAGGLYSREQNRNVFDLDAFREDPALYYRFAREFYPVVRSAAPNIAHCMLAAWEGAGREVHVVTQNVDDLHQRAGSSRVYPLHGDMLMSTCLRCGGQTDTVVLDEVISRGEVPHCVCGGVFKPDITFFGEIVPQAPWESAVRVVQQAELLVVIASSLVVYPAAYLPGCRPKGSKLVMINRGETMLDAEADLLFSGDLICVFEALRDRNGPPV